VRGDINTPWAGRAKEYAWSLCLGLAPRKITPTDVDYVVECGGKFAFFEMKTGGSEMPYGQERMFNEMLKCIGAKALLFVVEHKPLERVSLPTDVTRFQCRRFDHETDRVKVSQWLEGTRFGSAYAAFFIWADTGDMAPLRSVLTESAQAESSTTEPSEHVDWVKEYEAHEK
jgi:hypothetical protein